MNAPSQASSQAESNLMANELTIERPGGIPAHLRKLSEGTSFGNLSADDLKPPVLKLLRGPVARGSRRSPGRALPAISG